MGSLIKILVFNYLILSGISHAQEITNKEAYEYTLEFCSDNKTDQTGRMIEVAYSSAVNLVTGKSFYNKPSELLKHPGYYEALYECYGDYETAHIWFTVSILTYDFAGKALPLAAVGLIIRNIGEPVLNKLMYLIKTTNIFAYRGIQIFTSLLSVYFVKTLYNDHNKIQKEAIPERSDNDLNNTKNDIVDNQRNMAIEALLNDMSKCEDSHKCSKDDIRKIEEKISKLEKIR